MNQDIIYDENNIPEIIAFYCPHCKFWIDMRIIEVEEYTIGGIIISQPQLPHIICPNCNNCSGCYE